MTIANNRQSGMAWRIVFLERTQLTRFCAHYFRAMKNIKLSAEEDLRENTREVTRKQKFTVNALFREWLKDLVKQQDREEKLRNLDLRLEYQTS